MANNWKCPKCGGTNPGNREKCLGCNTQKPTINIQSEPQINRSYQLNSPIIIPKEKFEEIAGPVVIYVQELESAVIRNNTYLPELIREQTGLAPTPAQWARGLKMQRLPQRHGIVEGAQKMDDMLGLQGSLVSEIIKLTQSVELLKSTDYDDSCIQPSRDILSALSSVNRQMKEIREKHITPTSK